MQSIYQCPVCKSALNLTDKSYRCENGHSFDIAKEGYVNLLLAHQKRSKDAGDSKPMLQSRRSFLEKGYYDILPQFLGDVISHRQVNTSLRLLDTGCGEGYYTGHIAQRLGKRWACWGMDIAKPGIAMAARRYPDIAYFVASSYRLPIQDESLDLALRIYAPGDAAEYSRVLRPDGLLITVIPGRHHLLGLKQHIYDTPQQHDATEALPPGFMLNQQHTLRSQINIPCSTDIANLLAMTPYYWHAPKDKQQQVAKLEQLDTEIEFVVNIYQKISAATS